MWYKRINILIIMYIIELIAKILQNCKKQNKIEKEDVLQELYRDEDCNHLFMPLDSTGLIFSCIKCGKIFDTNSENK